MSAQLTLICSTPEKEEPKLTKKRQAQLEHMAEARLLLQKHNLHNKFGIYANPNTAGFSIWRKDFKQKTNKDRALLNEAGFASVNRRNAQRSYWYIYAK